MDASRSGFESRSPIHLPMKTRHIKRLEAQERADARAKLTPHEQMVVIHSRPGDSKKESIRLYQQIAVQFAQNNRKIVSQSKKGHSHG